MQAKYTSHMDGMGWDVAQFWQQTLRPYTILKGFKMANKNYQRFI